MAMYDWLTELQPGDRVLLLNYRSNNKAVVAEFRCHHKFQIELEGYKERWDKLDGREIGSYNGRKSRLRQYDPETNS